MKEDYEELLKRAYSQLPEKTTSGERFEMPVIDSFLQGNKTIIRNFAFIVQKLRRDPKMLIKYLSKELATPVSQEGDRLILNSKFTERQLNDRMQNFVGSWVVCKECHKPDTHIKEEGHMKLLICEACGARAPVKQ